MCALPAFSLPAFFFSQVKSSLNCVWFSPNSSVIGIYQMGKTEGCPQTKRGRKLKIQPDTNAVVAVFLIVYVCCYVSDKATHGELFIVFISRFNLNLMCLREIFARSRHNMIDKLVVPSSDRAQVLQTKCHICFWQTNPTYVFYLAKFQYG